MRKTALAAALVGMSFAPAEAAPLEIFVDDTTKQLFSEPGPNRRKLGNFVPANESATTVPAQPASVAAAPPAPTGATAKADKKWFDRLALRGYTQLRWDQELDGESQNLRAPGDRFIGDNQSLGIRRMRVVLSGDVSDYLSVYIQPDFASTPSGSSTGNFAQLRDAYADLYFDKDREYRIRAGQSKIPYGFENLQSSQNRLAPDRADALNSAVRDERDLGLIFYYTPKEVGKRYRDLVKDGLKGSGDYGVLGLGVYNGQGANRVEGNDSMHTVAHASYPFQFSSGQIVELGVDAYTGYFKIGTAAISNGGPSFTPTLDAHQHGFRDQRVAAHFIVYPQPFGVQGEWTVGRGPELDLAAQTVSVKSLSGGYLQAMYKIDSSHGTFIPYAKLQTYDGASKFDNNAPKMKVDEAELGVEWQIRPEIEVSAAYAHMERTNVGTAPYEVLDGDLLRFQLQWNY